MKRFLNGEANHYENLEVKYTRGDPMAIFFDSDNNEVERVPLAPLSTDEIGKLLESKNIVKKFDKYKYNQDL